MKELKIHPKFKMPGGVPRLSLQWEGVSHIMVSIREEVSNDTFALVLVAEDIDAANGNVSRMMYRRFLLLLVSSPSINDLTISH